jgi:tripartite ATP-independent transporter DctM subunit
VYTGIYTPTEGAGIAVVYTVIVSIYVYKNLKWSDLPRIIAANARSTGTILFVPIAAKPAGTLFEMDGLPQAVASLIAGMSGNRIVLMLVLYVFLIIVGMFMDATAAIFILAPILLPTVTAAGVSPLFFVVFLVITLSFGLITPPVGVCLYAAQNVTGLPLEKIIKASIPWIILIAVSLIIFIIFPQIGTAPVALVFGT